MHRNSNEKPADLEKYSTIAIESIFKNIQKYFLNTQFHLEKNLETKPKFYCGEQQLVLETIFYYVFCEMLFSCSPVSKSESKQKFYAERLIESEERA